jgi:hypothetical protein
LAIWALEPASEVAIDLQVLQLHVKVIPAFRHAGCWICHVGHRGLRTLTFNLKLTATIAIAASLVDG